MPRGRFRRERRSCFHCTRSFKISTYPTQMAETDINIDVITQFNTTCNFTHSDAVFNSVRVGREASTRTIKLFDLIDYDCRVFPYNESSTVSIHFFTDNITTVRGETYKQRLEKYGFNSSDISFSLSCTDKANDCSQEVIHLNEDMNITWVSGVLQTYTPSSACSVAPWMSIIVLAVLTALVGCRVPVFFR